MGYDLDKHLEEAILLNRSLYEGHDKQKDPYLSPVFTFTRAAMAHPKMTELSADSAAAVVDAYLLRRGHLTAEDGWELEFSDLSASEGSDGSDALAAFLELWDQIRCLPGESWPDAAWRRVNQRRTFHAIRKLPECKNMTRFAHFLALAAELQEMVGDKPILLPCREVGKTLGIDKGTVVAYRKLAVKHGFLRQLKRHRYDDGGHKEATEFKFDPSRLGAGRNVQS
jgi:hypothetical protein